MTTPSDLQPNHQQSSEVRPSNLVDELYEPLTATARHDFARCTTVHTITSPTTSAELLDGFLIAYCALGVHMTRPVDDWIRRAGQRCIDIGLGELGQSLIRHAEHEAGHHEMMMADTQTLTQIWNQSSRTELSATDLLARPPTPGVHAYEDVHERTISGPTPFAQLAIEYEIERLSITWGPLLLQNISQVCGQDRIDALSFLTHHVELDKGHTEFNRRQLDGLLAEHPSYASALGDAGSTALNAYRVFLGDCLRLAHEFDPGEVW